MRFLRFLRNDLSAKTSNGSRWLDRVKDAMHKARVAVGSPPSAPLNGITELFDKPLLWGEKPLCAGDPVSHHHSLRTEYARTAALRAARQEA